MSIRDIDAYWRTGFDAVEGWVAPEILPLLKFIGATQANAEITGNIAEIGVFRGKFLLALAQLSNPGERCIAIDIFDDQGKNIDGSGPGSMNPTRINWSKYAPDNCELVAIKADTLAMTIAQRVEIAKTHGPFRIFSVDGGHTTEHAVNDLLIAQEMLSEGGVILLDDIYHAHWPGVTEGLCNFYFGHRPRVVPFVNACNKLFLVSATYHRHFLERAREHLTHTPYTKAVKMFGWEVLTTS